MCPHVRHVADTDVCLILIQHVLVCQKPQTSVIHSSILLMLYNIHLLFFSLLVIPFRFLTFHQYRPDSRVVKLIKRMGERSIPNQKRVLCMNKIDLVEKKKDLTKVAEEFENLPGFER